MCTNRLYKESRIYNKLIKKIKFVFIYTGVQEFERDVCGQMSNVKHGCVQILPQHNHLGHPKSRNAL